MPILNEEQVIKDTYRIDRMLGEGAFAEVYRVEHRFLGRQAMKVFKDVGMTAADTKEALKEAKLLSELGHEHIIRVFDANVFELDSSSYGYFTMEYMPGGTLSDYLSGTTPSVNESVEIVKQICKGLAAAHKKVPPIVHRDVKPQNILVGYEGKKLQIRVSDFGLAKGVPNDLVPASCRGTEAFMAPEAFNGQCSAAVDVWAVGTTFYLLLAGHLPNGREASEFNVEVGADLDKILRRSMARDPNERYGFADEMLIDLENWSPLGLEKVRQALRLRKEGVPLTRSIKLMEEAFAASPLLSEAYEKTLDAWRRGILM